MLRVGEDVVGKTGKNDEDLRDEAAGDVDLVVGKNRLSDISDLIRVEFQNFRDGASVDQVGDDSVLDVCDSCFLSGSGSFFSALSLGLFLLFLNALLFFSLFLDSLRFFLDGVFMHSGVASQSRHGISVHTFIELSVSVDLVDSLLLKSRQESVDEGVLSRISQDAGVSQLLIAVSLEGGKEIFGHVSGGELELGSVVLIFGRSVLKSSSFHLSSPSVPSCLHSLRLQELSFSHLEEFLLV